MPTLTAYIVCQSLDIKAENIAEAEGKYADFFENNETCTDCRDKKIDCDCFSFDDSNVFHYFDEENEEANLHHFARVMAKALGKFAGFSMSANEIMNYIMNEYTNDDPSRWVELHKAMAEQEERMKKEEDLGN
jgi:hypothetical protein